MGPCLSLFKVPFSNGVDVNDSVWMSYDANNSSLPNQKRISKLESLQHFFTTGSNISFIDKYICSSKVLGKGGFSVVFEGYFLDSDDMVAVKKISKAKVVDVTRLKLEVKILRSMNHNNIMGFYDFFEEPLNYILVTELLIGGDLATRLSSKNNYNEKDARDLMVTLIETVRFIHQQDVVHRDLKLDNILLKSLDNDFDIKICDFGLATYCRFPKLLESVGTAQYAAPEVLNRKKYGKRVDIWALGVILYSVLSGKLPFDDEDIQVVLTRICRGQYNLDSERWQNVSSDAKDLIHHILEVSVHERYTLDDILKHPWCTMSSSDLMTHSLDQSKSDLRSFSSMAQHEARRQSSVAILLASCNHIEPADTTGIFCRKPRIEPSSAV